MATATSARHAVQKITARVFCQQQGIGGNPVTIFSCPTKELSEAAKQRLARSCQWESVVLHHNRPSMSFYMPTGEQVSFCAHAAMGGVMQMIERMFSSTQTTREASFSAEMQPNVRYQAVLHEQGIISLDMEAQFNEERVRHAPQLQRILRDALCLQGPDLVQQPSAAAPSFRFPSFCNSSIARAKTLVYVSSVSTLQAVRAPPVSDSFRIACDALESTGLYLYSPVDNDDFNDDNNSDSILIECRQFPRASGYPEDPATGIAAAALAMSLHARGLRRPYYKFQQGSAMGQPSLIMVENIVMQENKSDDANVETGRETKVSFRLTGKIEIDSREEIEFDDDA